MNLIEALKSGRKIRQKGKDMWVQPTKETNYFSIDEILDDWEAEESTVTITREQFNEAWDRAIRNMENGKFTGEALAKQLGL
jgi:hypothetical protein